ncbi:uncharacterized protein A4U43_C02F15870 [Asparagus officinalis]|uniref:Uncharacterized protein n=1 Tax=Asparagus officinalis TaxID=4686 RepID=A0A5P1FNL5_ASPOF|nr:uncharacterized protein A4U43_C02F15870 [Asparagus officinalis]
MKEGKNQVNILLLQDWLTSTFKSRLVVIYRGVPARGWGKEKRDSSRVRKDPPVYPVQEPKMMKRNKWIMGDDTDAYLTVPKDAGNFGDIGGSDDESDFEAVSEAMHAPFPTSSGFEPVTDFEGVEQEEPLVPKPSYDEGPSMAIATLSEPEVSYTGVEVVPMEEPTTMAMVVTELQAETERLSIIRCQAIPVDPRVFREQAQKGAHVVRDARMA